MPERKKNAIRRPRPEIMAPAGDFACLDAAIKAGADAVYFGIKGFNMRAGAKNFEAADLKRIAKICRAAGVKTYITLNTIYYDSELKKLDSLVGKIAAAGIDAVIAWDFAVFEAAKRRGVEVFLSTQASVANTAAAAMYFEKFGIKRFVLARECSLCDIAKIRGGLRRRFGRNADIKIEVFAHGAMCVSQSGRCFMSTFACGKSANRGECMQPCRREYKIEDANGKGFVVGNGYVMSPKDLCTIPFIEKIFEAGADSLKIEGRNRNPEYVFETVSAYRKLRDFYFDNRSEDGFEEDFAREKSAALERVSTVFNRGFSDGFFMGKPVGDWTSDGNKATEKKAIVGHVVKFFPKISVAEISIDAEPLCVGDKIFAEGDKSGFSAFAVESMQIDGKNVLSAKKGEHVGIKVPSPLRRLDRIYKSKKA